MNIIGSFAGYITSLFSPKAPPAGHDGVDQKLSFFAQIIFESESSFQKALQSESFFQRVFGKGNREEIKAIGENILKTQKEIERFCTSAGKKLSEKQTHVICDTKDKIETIDRVAKKRLNSPILFAFKNLSFSRNTIEQGTAEIQKPLIVNGIESIRGDGHCLFRATAHGLVDLYREDETFRANLDKKIRVLQGSNKKLTGNLNVFRLKSDLQTLRQLLPQGREKSDELQQSLRDLACTYNKTHRLDLDNTYFQDMRKTSWGGAPEIEALEQVLGIQITTSREEISLHSKEKPIIPLLHTGAHYNLIRPKSGN